MLNQQPICWVDATFHIRLTTMVLLNSCHDTLGQTVFEQEWKAVYLIRKMLRPLPKSLRWTLVHIWFGFNNNMVRSLEKSTTQTNSLLEKYIKDEFTLFVCDGYWDARLLIINFWYFWIKWSRSHRWELNCFIIIFTHTSLKLVMLCASDNTYNPSRSDIQTWVHLLF